MARQTKSADASPKPARKSRSKAASSGSPSPRAGGNKKLVVVESPAKARTINHYLGSDFHVMASMGHVRDLPAKDLGVDLEHNFEPTYEPLAGRTKVLGELKKFARNAPEIFLATDLDREGEAIAWHLAESLNAPPDRIRRVLFNEITASAIREAFAHPRDIDMNKVAAQQARRILDRIVGYKVSPLLWRKVSPGLSAGRVQSVAVRLIVERERQIEAFEPEEYWKISAIFAADPAAAAGIACDWSALLADRDEMGNGPDRRRQDDFLSQRQAFRAELVSWRGERFGVSNADSAVELAKALGLKVEKVVRTEDPAGKGASRNRVTVVGAMDPASAVRYAVGNINQRESRSKPPAPFTTVTMQQQAAMQLRFAAARTMRIAQQLYEGVDVPGEGSVGLITYMRTDSTHLSADAVAQVREMISRQYGPAYVPDKPNRYSASQRAQEAHEAVRPTDVRRRPEDLVGVLSDEQYRLYQLIWKRFVACQMPPAVWNVTEADIPADTPAGQAQFKAIGRTLGFDGFYRVAGQPRTGDQILPELRPQQAVAPIEMDPSQHFTQAPPRYTEASLIKALEADGIGRPSTYAAIIQTIQDRGYTQLLDRSFRPTDLGTVVTDKLVKHFPDVFDVRFTAHMEDQLDRVEDAQAEWTVVLKDFYGPFDQAVQRAAEDMVHAKAETTPSDYVCDTCGKPMVYRFSKNGRYLACTGYPECKQTYPVDADGKKVVPVKVDLPCPQCGKGMLLRRSRFGPFLGCSDYPNCKGTVPCDKNGNALKVVKEEDIHENCPECGAPMNVKRMGRRAFLGCSRYPECKTTAPIPEGLRLESKPKAPAKQAGVNCPKCGKAMVIREGRRGEFLACSGFPRCRNAMDLQKLDELKAQQAGQAANPATESASDKPKKKTAKKRVKAE